MNCVTIFIVVIKHLVINEIMIQQLTLSNSIKKIILVFSLFLTSLLSFAQMPKPALVGYWENWGDMKLTDIHQNYTVIQLAFGTTKGSSLYDMEFNIPWWYAKADFVADMATLQAEKKVIILSLGGASDPIRLDDELAYNTFVSSINKIMEDYNYAFDGIDIDFESSSLNFGKDWTMSNPSNEQVYLVDAIRAIQANYLAEKGKRMLLTMAPENIYVAGGLSPYWVSNLNGGAMLPIIEELRDDIDLLHTQFYNVYSQSYGLDGKLYDEATGDYLVAVTEATIQGFTIKGGKGSFSGFDADKFVIGLPAGECSAGKGYITPAEVTKAVDYLRGVTSKPSGWSYSLIETYPDLRGLMTWSINGDKKASCSGEWTFAEGFKDAFPEEVVMSINEKNTETVFSIYPNPTTDVVQIQTDQIFSTVVVYSVLGQQLATYEIENQATIDLSSYQKGIYLVAVNDVVQRVVKD